MTERMPPGETRRPISVGKISPNVKEEMKLFYGELLQLVANEGAERRFFHIILDRHSRKPWRVPDDATNALRVDIKLSVCL